MKKRAGILLALIGIGCCALGVYFRMTIGWWSAPLAFGIGIILLIASVITLVKRRN